MGKPRWITITEAFILGILVFEPHFAPEAFSSTCCGGSAPGSALITGDQWARLSVSGTQAVTVGDVSNNPNDLPIFRRPEQFSTSQSLTVEGAVLITDRWQLGAALSPDGLGTGLGYEILPEWTYSQWKPRGFLFVSSVPFSSLSTGLLLLKSWTHWDTRLQIELRTLGDRNIKSDLGLGYSPYGVKWRIGFNLQYHSTAVSKIWKTGLEASYLLSQALSVTWSYQDETLLGPAWNTQLKRSLLLAVSYGWNR